MRLDPTQRHRAQIDGAVEAYIPQWREAYGHALKKVLPTFLEEENVLVVTQCFRGWGLRQGLLFITDLRLVWTKQSFVRRHPNIATIAYAELDRLELLVDERFHRPALWPVYVEATGVGRETSFSFLESSYEVIPALRSVLARLLGERFVDLLPANFVTRKRNS